MLGRLSSTRATFLGNLSVLRESPILPPLSLRVTKPFVFSDSVSLSFRYLESDYSRAYRAHCRTRLRLPLDAVAVVLGTGVGIYLWRNPARHWLGVGCVALSSLLLLIIVSAFTVIPRLVFRRDPKFRDDYSLTFSHEGIHFRTASIDSRLQWILYSRALVDAHSYMLYYGSTQFTVIPKRVFHDAEQQQAFEHLLTQHVSQIVRR